MNSTIVKKPMLSQKYNNANKNQISLVLKFSKTLLPIKEFVIRYWHLQQIWTKMLLLHERYRKIKTSMSKLARLELKIAK